MQKPKKKRKKQARTSQRQPASAGRTTTPSQQVRSSFVLRCSFDDLELVSELSSGPNAEHRQLQIGIKDSPVRGATGHVAH